jgi:hypothetical protein
MPPANRRNGFLSLVVLAVANPKQSFALDAPPNACRSCEQVEISLRASKQLLLSSKFESRSIGATLEAGSLWLQQAPVRTRHSPTARISRSQTYWNDGDGEPHQREAGSKKAATVE